MSVVSVIQVTDISVTPYCGAVLTLSLPRLRVVTRKATSENAKLEITKIFFFSLSHVLVNGLLTLRAPLSGTFVQGRIS